MFLVGVRFAKAFEKSRREIKAALMKGELKLARKHAEKYVTEEGLSQDFGKLSDRLKSNSQLLLEIFSKNGLDKHMWKAAITLAKAMGSTQQETVKKHLDDLEYLIVEPVAVTLVWRPPPYVPTFEEKVLAVLQQVKEEILQMG